MRPNLLILGGTTEASALARLVAARGVAAMLSYAGRVAEVAAPPMPHRIGGFGGPDGLAQYLKAEDVTHVVDATHPFAAQMSWNAAAACAQTHTPLIALTRPPWAPDVGDHWRLVADVPAAVQALAGPPRRIFLAIGRQQIGAFAAQPQHHYLLRLVDPPESPAPLPDHSVVVDRGPFDVAADRALLIRHGVDLVVSKNSGGAGAQSKLIAARDLSLPVLMIERPSAPQRRETASPEEVMDWLAHSGADLGV